MLALRFFLIFLMFLSVTFSQEWFADFDKGVNTAKKEKKLVLIYFYSDHCPYCHQVEEFVFGDEDVEKFLNKNFIVISVNINSNLSEKFDVFGTPTFVIYDPLRGKVLAKFFGSLDAQTFLSMLTRVCNKSSVRRC
ncbi:thioredoxin family protein [Aquifex aeolicus]|uniref:Thioredoxin n=1 Tax=Aquifex aeolicus (strain VF5) TaxID=224324 RepID=O67676_AQUAE|nr:thioredoxin fold domain-containing protein [Aquifex aeolicus]AAC07635.1 thioredoxin [Aquifex aeolicus VF5]